MKQTQEDRGHAKENPEKRLKRSHNPKDRHLPRKRLYDPSHEDLWKRPSDPHQGTREPDENARRRQRLDECGQHKLGARERKPGEHRRPVHHEKTAVPLQFAFLPLPIQTLVKRRTFDDGRFTHEMG